MISKCQAYSIYISVISVRYLVDMLWISRVYLENISGLYHVYLEYISQIFQVYIISGISLVKLRYISSISQAYLMCISNIYQLFIKHFLGIFQKQAGAELYQAQPNLSQLHTGLDLATPLLGMLNQPAVDSAELQLRIYWHGGGGDEELNKACLS